MMSSLRRSWSPSDYWCPVVRGNGSYLYELVIVNLPRVSCKSGPFNPQDPTWKCLQGGSGFLLQFFSKFVLDEKVMYIPLIRKEAGIVRADRSVLVVLNLPN